MKKVTTAAIAIVIALILIISGSVYFGPSHGSHFSLRGVKESDLAVKTYLSMMIPHHVDAVEASKLVMFDKDITVPEVRLLAARIADAQEFEITQMQSWYTEWFALQHMIDASQPMPMVEAVKDKTGDDRAKTYLKEMISHHEEAIKDSRDTRELIEKIERANATTDGTITIMNSHPGIDTTLEFTKHVEEQQAKEIADMKALLKLL